MNQTITVSPKTIDDILARLDALTKDVKTIKTRLFKEEPRYGSDAWWEKENNEGLRDIKKGKYTELHTKKELQTFLDSLK